MNINSHVAGLHIRIFISDAKELSIYHKDGTKNLKFKVLKYTIKESLMALRSEKRE